MKFSTHVKPLSYLQSHATEIAREIAESGEPLLITENGEATLVVMDVRTYEDQQQTLALLKMLAMGKREIEEGRFRDAAELFEELDRDEV